MFGYRTSRDLRQVITEGRVDATLVDSALRSQGDRRITTLPVDLVEVDLQDYDVTLERNNRAKVLYLAQRFAEIPQIEQRVMCLVDSDTAAFRGVSDYSPLVVATDYADLGMYFVNAEAAADIARVNFHETDDDGRAKLRCSVNAAMYELAARAAMQDRKQQRAIPPAANYLDYKSMSIDREAFAVALRSVGLDFSEIESMVTAAERSPLPQASFTNSHDVCEALLKLFKQSSVRAAKIRAEELEDRFFLLQRHSHFPRSAAFEAIIKRLGT